MKEKTSSDNTHLCKTCARGMQYSTTDNLTKTFCHSLGSHIKGKVCDCTDYYNRSLPSLRDLYETAYILDTSKKQIGFQKYVEWKKGTKESLPFNDYD